MIFKYDIISFFFHLFKFLQIFDTNKLISYFYLAQVLNFSLFYFVMYYSNICSKTLILNISLQICNGELTIRLHIEKLFLNINYII